ncbi:MAG: VWA domain-containing protein, partial [Candidatus Sulfotelmatobacter sp.]
MRNRQLVLLIGTICLLSCWMFLQPIPHNTVAYAQQPTPAPDDAATIHVESRLVLVDTVVTDKKGTYIRDLTQKDFKVWEDGKEQPITSFSFEESNGSADSKPRYMVLFFDNSTMNFGDQAQARIAAKKFIDANAGPGRLIAIAEFGGTVRITQNFTSDASRLQQVVSNVQGSAVSPNAPPVNAQPVMTASLGTPPSAPFLGNAEADFGVHTVLLALRDLAKGLSTVPGRKTLVMLTSGFQMSPEYQSELTAVIDTCNKSNVAVYPIDVRGLVAPQMSGPHSRRANPSIHSSSPTLTQAAFHYSGTPALLLAAFAEPTPMAAQHGTGGGGGGGGGGGHGGGG